MKILIDEGVPVQITKALTAYTVETVQKRGWGGIGNGDLLLLAEKHYNLFITADKNLKYQQNLTGRTVSILELSTNKRRDIEANFELIEKTVRNLRTGEFFELYIPPA